MRLVSTLALMALAKQCAHALPTPRYYDRIYKLEPDMATITKGQPTRTVPASIEGTNAQVERRSTRTIAPRRLDQVLPPAATPGAFPTGYYDMSE